MQKAHCPRCAGYEDQVMRRRDGVELAPTVKPCDGFAMSDRFRNWAVSQMQKEVSGQISTAGLDRMAMVKVPKAEAATAAVPATETETPVETVTVTVPSPVTATAPRVQRRVSRLD